MFCPYPHCEWNDKHRNGNNFCARVKCPYSFTARATLWHEIEFLRGIQQKTDKHVKALEKLEEKFREEYGNLGG